MKYRKKPVVIEIEAMQWFKNGDHPQDYAEAQDRMQTQNGTQVMVSFSGQYCKDHEWEGGVVRYFRHPDIPGTQVCSKCGHTMHVHGWIDTLEDGHNVCPGDWIITGVQGEHYPCKPNIFFVTYEPA